MRRSDVAGAALRPPPLPVNADAFAIREGVAYLNFAYVAPQLRVTGAGHRAVER